MFDYTGYECKSCGKKFTEDDDIVVCPDCGTPYHRECWKANGSCINTEFHEKKISWKAEKEAEKENGKLRCSVCGHDLRSDQLFCDNCGTPTEAYLKQNGIERVEFRSARNGGGAADYSRLYGNEDRSDKTTEGMNPFMINYSDPLCGFNPEEEYDEGVKLKEVGAFVGRNTHYYLPKFRFMKTTNFKLSMNIAALFFPDFYFANRKMPLAALLSMIIKAAVNLPALALSMQSVFSEKQYMEMFAVTFPQLTEAAQRLAEMNFNTQSFNTLYYGASILNCVITVVLGSFANYFYYKHSVSKVAQIKSRSSDSELFVQRLRESGGTSGGMLAVFIVLNIILNYVCMGLVLFIM